LFPYNSRFIQFHLGIELWWIYWKDQDCWVLDPGKYSHVGIYDNFLYNYVNRRDTKFSCCIVINMPPRWLVTHQSPNSLNEGNEWAAEVSISAAKKLDFFPKEKSMIKISQKKPTNPPSHFKYTYNSKRSKLIMPSWLDLYNNIHYEYLPEFMPHNDLKVR